MPELISKIVYLALWLVATVFALIRWAHNLQLNSYKNKTQLRRFKETPEKLFCLIPAGISMGFALGFALKPRLWGQIMACLWMFSACLFLRPVRAKKPLVYTTRVWRLLGTSGVLMLVCGVAGYWLTFLPALALLLSPFVLMLANLLNAPIEKAVRNWYIKDAKRMLAESPDLLMLGVTGSYGKTSVKSYLGTLLNVGFDTLITPESYNTPMGVVRTVRERLRATHEVFVCEMGARHVGDIKELCDLVHPKHGIITAVGNQHLETFGTPERIRQTKYELADALPEGGLLYVNGDCEDIRQNPPVHPHFTYGLSQDCDYRAVDVEYTLSGTSFAVVAPDGSKQTYRTSLIGEHSVLNLTGAIAFCHGLGIALADLVPAVRKVKGVPHRMQLLPGAVTYIDDAYNSNPAGCKAALDTLARFDACKILVTPGMVELGDQMDSANETFGRQAAKVCDLCVLVGERQAVPIKRGLLAEGYPEDRIAVVSTLQEGLARVHSFYSEKKKIVLLENDLPDNY